MGQLLELAITRTVSENICLKKYFMTKKYDQQYRILKAVIISDETHGQTFSMILIFVRENISEGGWGCRAK